MPLKPVRVSQLNNYISKIIESLTFTNKEVEGFFKQIEKVLITYVDRKIG